MADTIAIVISLAAFGIAVIAAWATYRQAAAAETANTKADEANATSKEALRVAQEATNLERDRRHAELQPKFTLEAVEGIASHQAAVFTNNGPVEYERITLELGEEAANALSGFIDPRDGTTPLKNKRCQLEGTLVVGGRATVVLKRTSLDFGGPVAIRVTCYRGEEEWRASVPIDLKRVGRVWGV